MTRTKLFLIGLAVSAVAVIIVAVLVVASIIRYTVPRGQSQLLPETALTPVEILTEAAPSTDGTLTIRQRMSFETPPEGDDAVGLWISSAGLGRNPASGSRLRMMPEASEVTGVELSTEEGSTRDSPKTEGDLDIDVETKREEGFDYPSADFSFRPQDADGMPTTWGEGRHVVELSYVLDKVFLTVEGEEFLVLPVPTLGAGRTTTTTHTLSIDTDGPLYCPVSNTDFDLMNDCTDNDFAQVDDAHPDEESNTDEESTPHDGTAAHSGDEREHSSRLIVRRSYGKNIDVVAFAPPEGMTVPATRPYSRG